MPIRGVLLAIRWSSGVDEDRQAVKWMQAPRLPTLLRATSVTIGRKVRSRKALADASPEHVRHELQHVWQQARWLPWWPWLGARLWVAWYAVNPGFKRRAERDAAAQSANPYPEWRVIGTVHTGWWLW